jgi:flagellar biosynthetic protein FlhB
MSEHAGEKTEKPTPRRLEDAIKRGQFPRSSEVQTVFVLFAGMMALKMAGPGLWEHMVVAQTSILGHLHEIPLTLEAMPNYALRGLIVIGACVGPILIATLIGGLVAGGIQNRFQTASEALTPDWNRVNPVSGLQKIFSTRSLVTAAISMLKLAIVVALSYAKVKSILTDSTLYSAVSAAGIAAFIVDSAVSIIWRIALGLTLIAVLDYAYQFWRTNRDLMMTREEVKEEAKNSEGSPQVKAKMRSRRVKTLRQMLVDVPKADVVVTNPTHFAVALRYDRKTMKAPRIIAKGTRLNALKIREVATRHSVPIVENKPLARTMYKYGRVGGEVPAELYVAVAEVLAYVYRINRYRYYAEGNQAPANQVHTTKTGS